MASRKPSTFHIVRL